MDTTTYVVLKNADGELKSPKAVSAETPREALNQVLDDVSYGEEDYEVINPHRLDDDWRMASDWYVVALQNLTGYNVSWQ